MENRRVAHKVLVGKPKEIDHLEDPDVGYRIIIKWIFKTWGGSIDWIDPAQDRNRRQFL
jgi:hypothetical protein